MPAAAAVLAYSLADALGGSGFIAAFVGGMVFGGLRRRHGGEVGYLLEELGGVLSAVTFIVFGAVMLGPALGDATWSIALYAVLSLTLVRHAPGRRSRCSAPGAAAQTVGFLGWFGPRGLASIVFAVILVEEGGLPHESVIVTTIVITVGALGSRARAHRGAARRPLRRLVRVAPAGTPAERSRAASTTHVRWRTPPAVREPATRLSGGA